MANRDLVIGDGRLVLLALALAFVFGLSVLDEGHVTGMLNGLDRVIYGLF